MWEMKTEVLCLDLRRLGRGGEVGCKCGKGDEMRMGWKGKEGREMDGR